MPKALFPNSNKAGTVSPINGPATYQGHGFERNARMIQDFFAVDLLFEKVEKSNAPKNAKYRVLFNGLELIIQLPD
jgi:hypothetical protein